MVSSKSRAVTLLAVLLISTVLVAVALAAIGVFDPPLAQVEPIWREELSAIAVAPQSTRTTWLKEDLPDAPLAVELVAALKSGESDSAYGLIFKQESAQIIVAVSPLGNVAVWKEGAANDSGAPDFYLPWQTWPHVRTGNRANELLVEYNGGTVTVRLNSEWLWETDHVGQFHKAGIYAASFGEEAIIDFQQLELSAVQESS